MKQHALIFCLLFLIGLLSVACNRPAEEPSPDRMATIVAATLTAEPTRPPSATPAPSATPIVTPSSTATETATPGPSPTPPAPELPPDDPRYPLNLASPNYHDDFSSQFTWFGPYFEGAANIWDNNRLRATDNLVDANIWWSTTIREVDAGNLYAEITAEIGECTGKDSYGLAIRVSGEQRNSGYTLEFSCDGYYRMRKFVGGVVETLIDWSPSDAIQTGPDNANRMGILANGNTLHSVANGTVLDQVEDNDFYYGTFGLFASSVETPGITVYFDDFSLWYLTQ